MEDLFNGCSNLKSLDLSNFNTTNANSNNNELIFNDCNQTEYINLLNYAGKDIFKKISEIEYIICLKNFDLIEMKIIV